MKHKKKIFIGFLVLLIGVGSVFAYQGYKKMYLSAPKDEENASVTVDSSGLFRLAKTRDIWTNLAGFQGKKTYLVLFQNNTELRPSGGFIGSFAVVSFENGVPTVQHIDDSYNLDRFSIDKITEPAPYAISQTLGVKFWYFRDANWSPDFPSSAGTVLSHYDREVVNAPPYFPRGPFDGVIAVTPTVIERMLEQLGSVKFEGIVYTPEDFTHLLEYRVEYGYPQYGEQKEERKSVIGDLAAILLQRLNGLSLSEKFSLAPVFLSLLDEKHILLYSSDSALQEKVNHQGWAGSISSLKEGDDYVMVVDANLGSLKTDAVMKRDFFYHLSAEKDAVFSRLEVRYEHPAPIDWKTSQYRTYTRVYLPENSTILSVEVNGEVVADADIYTENEQGKMSVGFFHTVRPMSTQYVVLRYRASEAVRQRLNAGDYDLLIQKQPGTNASPLTVTIVAEGKQRHYQTDTQVDRKF